MKIRTAFVAIALLAAAPGQSAPPAPGDPPTDPDWQYSPQDFGVGRKHTGNAWCNREIDKLLDEVRRCFNTKPATECEPLQKAHSRKIGGYIRSMRCRG